MNHPSEPSHHHRDSFSYRGWLVSDKRHKRALAAIFYTFIVPLILLVGIFIALNFVLAIYLGQYMLRFAWNY